MSEKIDLSKDLYEFTSSIPGNAIDCFSFEDASVSLNTDIDVNYSSVSIEVDIETEEIEDYSLDSVDVKFTAAKLVTLLAESYEENTDGDEDPTSFIEAVAELLREEIGRDAS